MRKEDITDEQVEIEIGRLNQSEEVQLVRKEQHIKYKRRQYLSQLRYYEKRGKQLMSICPEHDGKPLSKPAVSL